MSEAWMSVRVARKWREATEIFGFELTDLEGRELPPFAAGSHIDVEVRPGLIRQYSLCNDPTQHHRYEIAVLREPASRGGSHWMIDDVREGAVVRISNPRNHFALVPTPGRTLLIAGGIGITPILCMAERLHQVRADFALHYACRSHDRAAFLGRLLSAPFANRVHLHFDDGPKHQLDLTSILARNGPEDHLYVCGPGGLIEAVLSRALDSGWDRSQLHREFFAPAQEVGSAVNDGPFRVKLASSGRLFDVPAGETIIQALSRQGVTIPTSCEQGVCGTCITRILEGVPDHRDFFLTDEERDRNDQMAVCCSRSKSPVLVLDL